MEDTTHRQLHPAYKAKIVAEPSAKQRVEDDSSKSSNSSDNSIIESNDAIVLSWDDEDCAFAMLQVMRAAKVHQLEGDPNYVKWETARAQLTEVFPNVLSIPVSSMLRKQYAQYFQAFVRKLAHPVDPSQLNRTDALAYAMLLEDTTRRGYMEDFATWSWSS